MKFISISSGNEQHPKATFREFSFFSPGLLLVVLGLVTILAPQFILAVISAFLLFCGGLMLYLGYKFFSFKRKLDQEVKRMQEMAEKESAFDAFDDPFAQFSRHFSSAGRKQASQRDPFSSFEGTSFEIDGETVEVMDAEEPPASSSPEKKGKVIIH